MKQTEKIIAILIVAFILTRFLFYIPALNTPIVILTLMLAGIYLFLSFALLNNIRLRTIFKKEAYKNVGVLRLVGVICTGLFVSLTCIYSLFKFMQWPFGNQGLMICLTTLLIPLVIAIIKYLTTKSSFYKNFLYRILIIGGIGALFLFTSSEKILELKFKDYPDYIEAEKNLMRDPSNKELLDKANEERKKIGN